MHTNALKVLKKHGKTFNFARLFLDENTGQAAARLYYFCRQIDDIADIPTLQDNRLEQLQAAINHISAKHYADPLVGDFLYLCDEYSLLPEWGIQLIKGAISDLDEVRIRSEEELICYAFNVAGVVGLMMTPILGGPVNSYRFAIDLGIGMQLTNIARDVLEDAQNNRRYLPGDWVNNLTPEQICEGGEHEIIVQDAIKRLLELAQKYYTSGFAGISLLPKKHRLGILIAGTVYQEIGFKLTHNHYQYLAGRTVVSKLKKLQLAATCFTQSNAAKNDGNALQHLTYLHNPIQHLLDFK